MTQYKVRFEGSGSGINDYGIIRIIHGQVFLCDANLADYARQFEGITVEAAFWASEEIPSMPMDEKIAPLVAAMKAKGIITLSSCQGHTDRKNQHCFPFVSCYGKPEVKLASGWKLENIGTNVWRLQADHPARDENDLRKLQESIGEQVKALA